MIRALRRHTLLAPMRAFLIGPQARRWSLVVASVLVALATIGLYAPARDFDILVYDDLEHLIYNPHLTRESGYERWRGIWAEPYFDLYVPVTYSFWAWAMDYSTTAQERRSDPLVLANHQNLARTLHSLNVVFHGLSAVVVLWLLASMNVSLSSAAVGSLLFAWHPLQIESVAWISEFRGVLATHLGLVSLLVWFYVMRKSSRASDHHRTNRWYLSLEVISVCLFVLGLLAKPSLVVLPVLALFLGGWFWNFGWKKSVSHLVPWFLVAMLVVSLTSFLQQDLRPLWPWWQRFFVAGDALRFYVEKLFWPYPLLMDYGRRPEFRHLADYLVACLPWGGVLVIAWRARKPAVLAGALGIFLLGLCSQLGFVASFYQAISTVADRYAYLAMLGPAYAVACVWHFSWTSPLRWTRYLGCLFGVLSVCALGVRTSDQLQVWRTSESLFRSSLEFQPRSYTALHGLGDLASMQSNVALAEHNYRQAIAARPEFAQGYASLGKTLLDQGRVAEAREALVRSLEIYADHTSARLNLGVSYQRLGDFDAALREYLAVQTRMDHPLAYFNAGTIYSQRGDWFKAESSFLKALEINPNLYQAHIQLSRVYEKIGRLDLRDEHLRAMPRGTAQQ